MADESLTGSNSGTGSPESGAVIVYDGACPFCSRYVRLLRLRAAVGPVRLVDMRQGGPIVDEVRARRLDLDAGMVLIYGGGYFHGADCIHRLTLLSTPSDLFNRVNALVFRSRLLSWALYPLLRWGRNLALALLRRPRLGEAGASSNSLGARGTGEYRRYRSLILLIPTVLLLYTGTALSHLWLPALPRPPSGEIFPFFSWDLFSSPRREAKLFTVRVTAVTGPDTRGAALVGRTLDDPRAVAFLRDARFQKTARALARAYWRKDDAEAQRMRVMLGNFLRPYGISEYELVLLSYQPLAYYAGSETPTQTVVARSALEPQP